MLIEKNEGDIKVRKCCLCINMIKESLKHHRESQTWVHSVLQGLKRAGNLVT